MDLTPSARTPGAPACARRSSSPTASIPPYAVYRAQVAASGNPHFHPPVMEELKAEARARGLWNLFLPDPELGAGLSNVEYAPLCELTGRSPLAPEATNCSAPDTGNMELLAQFASPLQREQYLQPLLDGEIRSGFAMTEPWVASSDATNIESRITADGDSYVIDAHKWWTTGAASDRCTFVILMGVSDPDADPHRRHSMIIVPLDTPGVTNVRTLARARPRRRRRALRAPVRAGARPQGEPARPRGRGLRARAGTPRARAASITACARSAWPSTRSRCCACARNNASRSACISPTRV